MVELGILLLVGYLFLIWVFFFFSLSRRRKKLMSFVIGEDFDLIDLTCMNVFVLAFENFNAVCK